jgi:hypothetical protein
MSAVSFGHPEGSFLAYKEDVLVMGSFRDCDS